MPFGVNLKYSAERERECLLRARGPVLCGTTHLELHSKIPGGHAYPCNFGNEVKDGMKKANEQIAASYAEELVTCLNVAHIPFNM